MDYTQAKAKADKFVKANAFKSNARRPLEGMAMGVRYPVGGKMLIQADTPEKLTEKLARRLVAEAKRTTKH